jgi:hypothetical protein
MNLVKHLASGSCSSDQIRLVEHAQMLEDRLPRYWQLPGKCGGTAGRAPARDLAEEALAAEADPWDAFAAFIRGIIDADVHSLTVRLAGTFTPTQELHRLAGEANKLSGRLFRRAKAAGVLRADLHLNDVAMLFEQVTAIRLGDAERTQTLRHRYLALQLDALRPEAATSKLPAPPPTSAELGRRWIPTSKVSGR